MSKMSKYCKYCGSKLVVNDLGEKIDGYDEMTGEPIKIIMYVLACPKWIYMPYEFTSQHTNYGYKEKYE